MKQGGGQWSEGWRVGYLVLALTGFMCKRHGPGQLDNENLKLPPASQQAQRPEALEAH